MPTLDVRKNKDLIIMIMALGDAYLEKGLYVEAGKRYKQLLDYKIANKQIYSNFSKALMGLKKFDKFALGIYEKAIQYDTSNTEIYILLASTFLKEGRDDDAAIMVYEMALKHDAPNYNKIASFLADVYFKRNDFNKCKIMTQNLLLKSGYSKQILHYYLTSIRQLENYNDAVNLLKKLIDENGDSIELLGQISEIYLEKKFNAELYDKKVKFSFIDKQLIADFLNSTTHYETLQELSFYLELKSFLFDNRYWGTTHDPLINQVEYVAEQGNPPEANAENSTKKYFNLNTDVLSKLNAFDEQTGGALTPRSSLTYEDFQKSGASIFSATQEASIKNDMPDDAEVLMVVEFANFDDLKMNLGTEKAELILQTFYSKFNELFVRYQISHAWNLQNGFILFEKEIIRPLTFSIDLLNRLSRDNFENDSNHNLHLSIGIHHTKGSLHYKNEQTLIDFSAGIKLATISEKEISVTGGQENGRFVQKKDRIFISDTAYEQIKKSNRFKVNSLGEFKVKYLTNTLNLLEVAWRNPSNELKFGFIKKLGRFELLAELSNKGAIKVYKAKDADLHRFVILKVIQSEKFNSLPNSNPQKMQFFQITKAQSQMNHPNIVNIYEIDEDHGLTYIAREYVEAQSITDIFNNGNLNIDRFIKIIYQVFKGLQYSHRFGFFHHNLKPNNIFITNNDEIKLTDFLIPGYLLSENNGYSNTNSYLSPEQVQGQRGDGRTDVFTLGVIMYETLTQRHPFIDNNYKNIGDAILNKQPLPPSEANKKIPRFCDTLVLKCIEKDPAQRFQSVEQVVHLLKKNFERTLFSNFNFQIAQSRDSY